ncbi:MAG TPA: O-antigen ligase family protein, partial [Anaerolineae bacterium]
NVPVPIRSTLPPDDPLQLLTWQFAPLASLVLTGILACAWARPAATARILAGLHALSVSLLPIGLSFWVFRDLVPLSYPRIYFTYTDVLFFASDGLIAIAVVAWALSRWVQPKNEQASVTKGKGAPVVWLTRLLLALCVVATLSAIWSVDARLSLATSAHLWLLFLFYLSLKNHPVSLRLLTYGASVALLIQAGIGFVEVIGQTTAFLSPLRMQWPGDIVPAQTGASVVQLADGARWLRAYGSFPHPNILGGWASAMMMAPAGWLLLHHRLRLLAIAIVMASAALIFLSFSRSAWLGCAVGLMVLGFHWRQFARRRLIALALAALLGFGAAAIPLYRMVFTRVAGFGVATEQQSIEVRTWMTEHSLMMIGAHPWLGVGIGGFVVELVNRNPGDFLLEPAHNVALLVAAELGLPGLLLVAGIGITLAIGIFKAKQPLAVVASMMVIVLASVAAFDHFLWTIAPGRDLLWFALGIWAGWQLPAMSQNQNDRRLRS